MEKKNTIFAVCFPLSKIFKYIWLWVKKLSYILELMPQKEKSQSVVVILNFARFLTALSTFDFCTQKLEKVTESYGVLSKSRTQFKGNAHSNSNQLNFRVPMRSQTIYFHFCTRFLGNFVRHFLVFVIWRDFSWKFFDTEKRKQNFQKLLGMPWEHISST